MNCTQKEKDVSADFLFGLLDSLPLPDHYKPNHLLNHLADLPLADLPAVVEPVLLNTVSVQTTCMPSSDVLPWHLNNDDPGPAYRNRECRVKCIRIDTSNFTSNLYPEFDNNRYSPVFDDDNIPLYDSPTKFNHLDVGNMNEYWSYDPEIITVNAVKIAKDDPTAIQGQFDSGADATVTNLLIFFHIITTHTLLDSSVPSDSLALLVPSTFTLWVKTSYICQRLLQVVTLVFVVSIHLT